MNSSCIIKRKFRFIAPWLFVAGFFPTFLLSQPTANIDLPSLESPYSTMYTHLYFLQVDSYQPELAARTVYGIADSVKAQNLVIKLKQIMDGQGLFVVLESLPRNPVYKDSLTNKFYFTPFPNQLPQVYLERIDSSWYYSRETVALVPELHQKIYPFGSGILVDLFPKMGQKRILGLAMWQYLGILILLLLAWLAHKLLSRLINPFIKFLSRRHLDDAEIDMGLVWKAARMLSILLVLSMLRFLLPALLLPIRTAELLHKGLQIFATVFLVLFLLRIVDLVIIYARKWTTSTEYKYDEQLIPIIKTSLLILVILGGIIHVLQVLSINVTALIAGISIGGLALALAAQDTVKNLIGSAMIFVDRPFQIGDYIEWAGQAGTVMEVGFRTTRIRTSDTSIISVPNGTIANVAVTNKGLRVYRLFALTLGINYDTPPDLIEQFVESLREMVRLYPQTHNEDVYIYLNNMSASSLDIFFRVYLRVPSYAEELRIKEELLLSILRLAEVLKIRFAFPSSSVYVEQFPEKYSPTNYITDPAELKEELDAFFRQFDQNNSSEPDA